jgi:hypothetical protein
MPFCTACGKQNPDDARFCARCGTKLVADGGDAGDAGGPFLDDVTVSRRHAVFTREGAEFTVADAGSLNGTYVNRDRIDKVTLKDSDEVQIGKYRLVFFAGHTGAAAAG